MIPHIRLVKTNITEAGWGNGYVVLPKGHLFHGLDTFELDELLAKDFHFPISYAEAGENGSWVVGFDTMHSWCNKENCSLEVVENLAQQLHDLLIIKSK